MWGNTTISSTMRHDYVEYNVVKNDVTYLLFDHFKTLDPKGEFTTVHAKRTGVTNDSLAFLNNKTAFPNWEEVLLFLHIIYNSHEANHKRDNKGKHIDRRRNDSAYQSCNCYTASSHLYSFDFFKR